jgi:hypothetical protein
MSATDSVEMPTAYSAGLRKLVGLKITMASHAASLRGFIFAPPTGTQETEQWALHIQCPWRIEAGSAILTGSSDWDQPAELSTEAEDDWDPAEGGSLQEARLRELFKDHDLSKRTISNKSPSLVCTEFEVEANGDTMIRLTGDYILRLFPAASRGEHWRVFKKGDTNTHVICEA